MNAWGCKYETDKWKFTTTNWIWCGSLRWLKLDLLCVLAFGERLAKTKRMKNNIYLTLILSVCWFVIEKSEIQFQEFFLFNFYAYIDKSKFFVVFLPIFIWLTNIERHHTFLNARSHLILFQIAFSLSFYVTLY